MFVSIGGFPLTIAPMAISLFMVRHFYLNFNTTKISLIFILIFWPIIIFFVYLVFIKSIEITEFVTTYFLWLFGCVVVTFGCLSQLKKVRDYSTAYFFILLFIVIFSILQVLMLRIFNSALLYNPFGVFTYFSQYSLDNVFSLTGPRAYGLFLEPSYNAFIMFFLMSSILINLNSKYRFYTCILGSVGILFTASASGILLTFILFFLLAWMTIIRNNIVRVFLLMFVPFLFFLMIPEELMIRLNEVNLEGTSGYWRLVAPIRIIYEAISVLPIGLPFGQINEFVYNLGIYHGGQKGTSLDNGFAVLFFYFGLFAFVFALCVIYNLFVSVYSRNYRGAVFWWFVFASLQFSGGIFLPEFIYPLLLILYQYKVTGCNARRESI